jgi:preprotein translocase subunit SecF
MRFDILEKRKIFFSVSWFFIVVSLIMMLFWTLNLGIDMTGGTQSEFSYTDYEFSLEQISAEAQTIKWHINVHGDIINTVNTYKVTGEKIFVVETGFSRNFTDKELDEYKTTYRDELELYYKELWDIHLTKYTNIGASFGDYIRNTAKITLLIAIVAIAVYIAYTFSWTVSGISSLSFAAITIVTLFHDVIISSGLYIMVSWFLPQFQIDTFFITALLTILWYSINDTIVIFDRIRSNLRDFGGKWKDLGEIISLSIDESITRSIYTSLTLAFVLICILILGPESIGGFTLAMLFGTIVGTFSSIFIASPLLYEIHKNTVLSEYVKKEERSEDDKMVV